MIVALPPALTSLTAAAPAPVLASGTGADVSLWRVVLALVLCLVLAGGAAWLLRQRLGGAAPWPLRPAAGARLRLVERITLGPQSSATLIALDGRELLVVTSVSSISVQPVDPAPPAEQAP